MSKPTGCTWEYDENGVATSVSCSRGIPALLADPSLQAQKLIGEEDQSVPGWDSFP